MNRRKPLVIILSIILVLALGFFLFTRLVLLPSVNSSPISREEKISQARQEYKEYIDLWESNHKINEDYVAQLWFESGLINEPVVQAEDNDKYFRTNWQTMKHDEEGTPYVDYRVDLKGSQNIIIYGHNVEVSYEPSKTHKFTPLHQLETVEGIKDNNIVYLLLEDRLLKYEVAMVYRADVYVEDGRQIFYPDTPKFFEPSFINEQFNTLVTAAKKTSYNDYEYFLDKYDKLLTMQTCIDGSINKFVVTCKLIETTYIK